MGLSVIALIYIFGRKVNRGSIVLPTDIRQLVRVDGLVDDLAHIILQNLTHPRKLPTEAIEFGFFHAQLALEFLHLEELD
jgi:hypothetical protein